MRLKKKGSMGLENPHGSGGVTSESGKTSGKEKKEVSSNL